MVRMLRIRSKVGPKGQTVIPKPVREELGLKAGDDVFIHTEGGRAVLEPATRRDALDVLLGLGPKRPAPKRIDWHSELGARYE